jgi:hypothetical protein
MGEAGAKLEHILASIIDPVIRCKSCCGAGKEDETACIASETRSKIASTRAERCFYEALARSARTPRKSKRASVIVATATGIYIQ